MGAILKNFRRKVERKVETETDPYLSSDGQMFELNLYYQDKRPNGSSGFVLFSVLYDICFPIGAIYSELSVCHALRHFLKFRAVLLPRLVLLSIL